MADGITLRGTTNKTFNWVDSTDSWTSSENIDLAANKKFTVASNPVMCPVGMLAPFAGASAPDGWLLCAGQAVSRSTYAALFAVVSTTYGSGDGSTTFNLPDLRGRTAVGKDDMGGSAANRVTAGISGIAGITLGAVGGNENVHQHSHANTATFTGSAVNTTNESSHTHANTATFTGSAGTTGTDSPDHAHGPGNNTHFVTNNNTNVGSIAAGNVYAAPWDKATATAGASARHAHSFTPAGTVTMSNAAGSAHLHSVTAAGTVTMTNANFGSGSSQNMQPSIILNYIIKH